MSSSSSKDLIPLLTIFWAYKKQCSASSQEQLAVAAQNAVTTIVQLSEVVKAGATSLGAPNREAQVMLINAVKDVASALSDLMQSTKAASGKNIQDPAMHQLKDSAKVNK